MLKYRNEPEDGIYIGARGHSIQPFELFGETDDQISGVVSRHKDHNIAHLSDEFGAEDSQILALGVEVVDNAYRGGGVSCEDSFEDIDWDAALNPANNMHAYNIRV